MSDKIIIAFEGKKESEIDTGGVFSQIGYNRLRKLLEPVGGVGDDEVITGLIIDKNSIKIRIEQIS